MDAIERELLKQVADIESIPVGAFNIRKDSGCEARQSTEHIEITPKTDGADTTAPAASVTSPAATSGVARTTSIATSTPGRSHNPASATAFSNARNCDISTLSIATTTASCVPTSAFNSPAPTICGTIFAPPAKSAELSLGNT